MELLESLLLERAFGQETAAQYHDGYLPHALLLPVARAATELSLRFTGRQPFGRAYLQEKAFRLAYLLYYLPSNLPKSGFLLGELQAHPDNLLHRPILRILDLGAGQGAATLGVLDFLVRQAALGLPRLALVAVEEIAPSLEDYRWLVSHYLEASYASRPIPYTLETYQAQLERGFPAQITDSFDLILVSNVLSELFRDEPQPVESQAQWLAQTIAPRLAEDGSLLIIEPALRETTNNLMRLRDILVLRYGLQIYSPCPAGGLCPMRSSPECDNWCHSVVDWSRSDLITQLDQLIGNRKEMLKFSYLILRRDGRRLADAFPLAPPASLWRLVSDPHREKGKTLIYGCGSGSYFPLVRLKRAACPGNAAWKSIERGQLLAVENPEPHGGEIRIGSNTTVVAYGPVWHGHHEPGS